MKKIPMKIIGDIRKRLSITNNDVQEDPSKN
jgi:hypothetical protein